MAKSELGKKRFCSVCSTKYYDMNRAPVSCPMCGAQFHAGSAFVRSSGEVLGPRVEDGVSGSVSEAGEFCVEESVVLHDSEDAKLQSNIDDDTAFLEVDEEADAIGSINIEMLVKDSET